jgi:hypothetical protein
VKQPMAYSKGKAAKIRKARRMAASMKSRGNIYKRIATMTEVGAGTENYRVTVRLVNGWSFTEKEDTPVAVFSSTAELMIGVSKTYPSGFVVAGEIAKEDADEMTWQEKLTALAGLSK